jgi:predicted  nucleic acid-binding Zn-ribbon protein
MQDQLKVILDIQEFDIKMIRLMKLKKTRQRELEEIDSLKKDLSEKIVAKEEEIEEAKSQIASCEERTLEVKNKIKHYESQQDLVKKIDEFNALNQEISHADRERASLEQKLNAASDSLMAEEEVLASLQEAVLSATENSKVLEKEIQVNLEEINKEGAALKAQRDVLVEKADEQLMKTYQKLLNNKRDRVVVPIANRCCSGCHIILTAQQENLVRKAERLIFCEHCSRILYWADTAEEEADKSARRRRKKVITAE